MKAAISATMLYNYVRCPHRFYLDLFGDQGEKDRVSPFVQLLWERGHAFETEVMSGSKIPYLDLSGLSEKEKEEETLRAMEEGELLIYSGRISADDLIGIPDLLSRNKQGYIAGDIKSGSAEEGNDIDHMRPKKHYAVQLALYTDILERLGVSAGRTPFIWDVHGREVFYDLDTPQGKNPESTLWNFYKTALQTASEIRDGSFETKSSYSSVCKLCQWHTHCMQSVIDCGDLTQIPELGRSKRDKLSVVIPTITELAKCDLSPYIQGAKTTFPGIRASTLRKFQERARLQTTKGSKPYLIQPVSLPKSPVEIFFDIETDPMRDHCYLHGFLFRFNDKTVREKYINFLASSPTDEEEYRVFCEALDLLQQYPEAPVYYYSAYERTYYKRLAEKYPEVVSIAEIEALYAQSRFIDLYSDIIRPLTEWPTIDFSIKTLARYLGFNWRDTNPSGAASVEWYHRWVELSDPELERRILEYNMDDCIAMRVLADAIRTLPVKS